LARWRVGITTEVDDDHDSSFAGGARPRRRQSDEWDTQPGDSRSHRHTMQLHSFSRFPRR
jgi:hypothetical protein